MKENVNVPEKPGCCKSGRGSGVIHFYVQEALLAECLAHETLRLHLARRSAFALTHGLAGAQERLIIC